MRNILLSLIFVVFSFTSFSQQANYQTYKSVMKISAFKDGENIIWENKDLLVRLDYKIGEFITRLKNTDFYNDDMQSAINTDDLNDEREFVIKGVFPISLIIDQRPIEQNYVVELQLINDQLLLNKTIMFNMTVTRPSQSQSGNYRVFLLRGKMYNDELQLPGFEGFDNEIEIFIGFNAFWNKR